MEEDIGLGSVALKRLGYDIIDEEIRPIVRALNEAGYYTWASCAGGRGHDEYQFEDKKYCNAWISFENSPVSKEDMVIIRDIVSQHTKVPFKVEKGGISFSRAIKKSW